MTRQFMSNGQTNKHSKIVIKRAQSEQIYNIQSQEIEQKIVAIKSNKSGDTEQIIVMCDEQT